MPYLKAVMRQQGDRSTLRAVRASCPLPLKRWFLAILLSRGMPEEESRLHPVST